MARFKKMVLVAGLLLGTLFVFNLGSAEAGGWYHSYYPSHCHSSYYTPHCYDYYTPSYSYGCYTPYYKTYYHGCWGW